MIKKSIIKTVFCILSLESAAISGKELDLPDAFYRDKQYDLAQIEYTRIYLRNRNIPGLKEKLALSCMRRNQYRDSLVYLDNNNFASLYLSLQASLFAGFENKSVAIQNEINTNRNLTDGEKHRAQMLFGTLYLEKGRYDDALLYYEDILKENTLEDVRLRVQDIIREIRHFQSLSRKSPLLSGIYSALLPGSGQIYSGHTIDGISAFLFTGGSFVLGGYLNRLETKNGNDRSGSIVIGLVSLLLYSANITGAVSSAKRYNIYEERNWQYNLREKYFSLEEAEKSAGISFVTSF